MNILLATAMSYVGVPYKWGGNNPVEGFDCSGLVQELLKSTGEALPQKDNSAQMLFDHYQKNGEWNRMQMGALVFFGESATKVTHVGMLVDDCRFIEAGGGGHLVLNREDAAAKSACVRIRHLDSRKDRVAIIRPYYRAIKQI